MRDPSQTLDLVIQRQIESTAAGNGAYLATFLRVAEIMHTTMDDDPAAKPRSAMDLE